MLADGFAMPLSFRLQTLALLACSIIVGSTQAAERPTFNHDTCDPRPDILPYWIHNSIPEYRLRYNRPRFLTGYIAHKISPTSQEAMVWKENVAAGSYKKPHMPPRYKRYFAPKPWEALQTGARPDFENNTGSENSPPSPGYYDRGTEAEQSYEQTLEFEEQQAEIIDLPSSRGQREPASPSDRRR